MIKTKNRAGVMVSTIPDGDDGKNLKVKVHYYYSPADSLVGFPGSMEIESVEDMDGTAIDNIDKFYLDQLIDEAREDLEIKNTPPEYDRGKE
jgi:hypothetical protein